MNFVNLISNQLFMKKIFIVSAISFHLLMSSCASDGTTPSVATSAGEVSVQTNEVIKTPEQLREDLRQHETASPLQYVSVEHSTFTENTKEVLIREEGLFNAAEYANETDGYTVEGVIKNSASIATFKDVVLTINYISKTNTIISSEQKTFYELYGPTSSNHYSVKVYPPDEFNTLSVELTSAVTAE